jgi:hypothetical protein
MRAKIPSRMGFFFVAVIGSGFPGNQNDRNSAFAEISRYRQSVDANMFIFHRKSKKAVLSVASWSPWRDFRIFGEGRTAGESPVSGVFRSESNRRRGAALDGF